MMFLILQLLSAPVLLAGLIYDERCIGCIEIDVYFHLIAYDNFSIFVQNKSASPLSILPMIASNMEVANQLFNETPFVFKWRNPGEISIVNNTAWTLETCTKLRFNTVQTWSFIGDRSSAINVYLGHQMDFNTNPSAGCGSFPWHIGTRQYIGMAYEILPPGGNGLTLAHEFGHWLGLLHTFQAYRVFETDPCREGNPGDFVDDTPTQLSFDIYNYTNETSWDSCPTLEGEDAFWNIMNKVCARRTCFGDRAYITEDQTQRMYHEWIFARQHNESCSDEQELLDINIMADYVQINVFDQDGIEVLNLARMWSGLVPAELSLDFCIWKNTTYTVVVFVEVYYPLYDLDGVVGFSIPGSAFQKEVPIRRTTRELGGNATSFVVPSSDQSLSSRLSEDLSSVYASFDECSTDDDGELLLDIAYGGEGLNVQLLSAAEQMEIEGRTCISRDRAYVLTFFVHDRSSGFGEEFPDYPLGISVGGKPIFNHTGPNYPFLYNIPQIFSTWILPAEESSVTKPSSAFTKSSALSVLLAITWINFLSA